MSKHQLVLCELADAGLPSHESFSPFCIKVHRALRVVGLAYLRRHGSVLKVGPSKLDQFRSVTRLSGEELAAAGGI
jgi:hypothetical protein